ncbi:MAG: hypothetical protein NUV77_25045, partial [Thermoguttaceae bacterium]|nr:hypothetical protein [Thermoguttaceae bacterium]
MPRDVTQRGNRRQQTFFHEGADAAYLKLMAQSCGDRDVEVSCFAAFGKPPVRFKASARRNVPLERRQVHGRRSRSALIPQHHIAAISLFGRRFGCACGCALLRGSAGHDASEDRPRKVCLAGRSSLAS